MRNKTNSPITADHLTYAYLVKGVTDDNDFSNAVSKFQRLGLGGELEFLSGLYPLAAALDEAFNQWTFVPGNEAEGCVAYEIDEPMGKVILDYFLSGDDVTKLPTPQQAHLWAYERLDELWGRETDPDILVEIEGSYGSFKVKQATGEIVECQIDESYRDIVAFNPATLVDELTLNAGSITRCADIVATGFWDVKGEYTAPVTEEELREAREGE